MCKVLEKTDKKKAMGYKVVYKIGSRYYSPATGLQYKVGMEIPTLRKKRKNIGMWADMLNKENTFYTDKMHGKTGVYVHENDATGLLKSERTRHENVVLLKMTLGGEIYNGWTNTYDTFIGTEILEIKELKDE